MTHSALNRTVACLAVVAVAAVASAPHPARAQRPEQAPDTARVPAVIVTATRAPLAAERVPASVTVLDGAALRAEGVTTVADALRRVPGVAVARAGSDGAQSSLFVRGGQGNHTRVLIDGVPYNDPGGALDLANLTLDDVERIEVVRGPASVVYGSEAMSGVIQIITRRPAGTPRSSADLRGGTRRTIDAGGHASAGIPAFAIAADVAHHETDGIYAFNSRHRSDILHAGVATTLWRGADVRATARYADVRSHFPTDFTGAPVDPNAFRTERRTMLGAVVGQRAGQGRLSLALTSNIADASIVDPPNGDAGTASETDSHIVRQSAELRGDWPLARWVRGAAGAGIEHQHLLTPDATRRNASAWGELVHDDIRTTVALGARLDRSDTYGHFGTVRAALARRLSGDVRIRASVGNAFREPSFFEAYATPYSVANPALRPERTVSADVGVDRTFAGDRASVALTAFAQRFTDLVDYHYDAAGSRFENIARARAAGLELSARAMTAHGLLVDGSATLLDTRVLAAGFDPSSEATLVEGGPLLRRPRWTGSLGLGAPLGRAVLEARATIVGPREDRRFHGAPDYSTDAVTLPTHTSVDLDARLPLGRSVTATARVENAFDARYESIAGYLASRRRVLLGLRLR